jgi:hypothetical protein
MLITCFRDNQLLEEDVYDFNHFIISACLSFTGPILGLSPFDVILVSTVAFVNR